MQSSSNPTHKTPCPECRSAGRDRSGDNLVHFDDGHAHCFACGYRVEAGTTPPETPKRMSKKHKPLLTGIEFREITGRRLQERTCARFGYGLAELDDDKVHVAPYCNAAGEVVAQKVRTKDKNFIVLGDMGEAGLFGQQLCRAGGKRLVITEGEIDALSVAQAFGLSWDVVSVPNGAQGARRALQKHLEFVESYEEVVLFFDNDPPGIKAANECAELLSPGKAKIATAAPAKDANELLQQSGSKRVQEAVWNARAVRPDGVLLGTDCWDALTTEPAEGLPLPWPRLNELLGGVRPGELTTIAAGTGQGKSSLVRHVAWHMRAAHDQVVGYLGLEESVAKTTRYLVGIDMRRALWLPGVKATAEEMRPSFDRIMAKVALLDNFGTLDPDVLLSRIRYMAKGLGATIVVLDHVSIVASGFALDTDERRGIDLVMTRLRSLVEETGIHLFVVSHLRRVGDSHEEGGQVSLSHLRGSQSIQQLSDNVIALERDQQDEDEDERAICLARVLKCRVTGNTGPAEYLRYDRDTGRFEVAERAFDEKEKATGGSDF